MQSPTDVCVITSESFQRSPLFEVRSSHSEFLSNLSLCKGNAIAFLFAFTYARTRTHCALACECTTKPSKLRQGLYDDACVIINCCSAFAHLTWYHLRNYTYVCFQKNSQIDHSLQHKDRTCLQLRRALAATTVQRPPKETADPRK